MDEGQVYEELTKIEFFGIVVSDTTPNRKKSYITPQQVGGPRFQTTHDFRYSFLVPRT